MLNIFPYMFYTIHWPIPVEVLVRIKYPMLKDKLICTMKNAWLPWQPLTYFLSIGYTFNIDTIFEVTSHILVGVPSIYVLSKNMIKISTFLK